MKTIIITAKKATKRLYNSPRIERISLDNEISLILASDLSPFGEPDNWSKTQEHFKNDPFKINMG